jgi:hypothetical protein
MRPHDDVGRFRAAWAGEHCETIGDHPNAAYRIQFRWTACHFACQFGKSSSLVALRLPPKLQLFCGMEEIH